MKKLAAQLALALVTLTSLTGCAGYQLGASRPAKMAGVTTLSVPTFKNETLEPRLEVLVTNAVIKKLQADGAYKIVGPGEGDATLKATIFDIERNQFRSARNNTLRTSEILMRLIVKYDVVDSAGTKLMGGQIRGESNLVLDPNTQLTERQALADAAERLSSLFSSELSEGW
jgi:hypothetical protein